MLKKILSFTLALVLALGVFTFPTFAADAVSVTLDGRALTFDQQGAVEWDGNTQAASIAMGGISLYPAYVRMPLGYSLFVDCEAEKGAAVEWSSSDPAVATVSSDGEITALSDGVAEITARIPGKAASVAHCSISVYEAPDYNDEVVSMENPQGCNILTIWEYPPEDTGAGPTLQTQAQAAVNNLPISMDLDNIPEELLYGASATISPASATNSAAVSSKKVNIKKQAVQKMLSQEKFTWSITVTDTVSVIGELGKAGPPPGVREDWFLMMDVTRRNQYDKSVIALTEYYDNLDDYLKAVLRDANPPGPAGTYIGNVYLNSHWNAMDTPEGRGWLERTSGAVHPSGWDPHPGDSCDMECIYHVNYKFGDLSPGISSNGSIIHEYGVSYGFKIIEADGYEFAYRPGEPYPHGADYCNDKNSDGECKWDWHYEYLEKEKYVDRNAGKALACDNHTDIHGDDSFSDERDGTELMTLCFFIEISGDKVFVGVRNCADIESVWLDLLFMGDLTRRLDNGDWDYDLDFSSLGDTDY